MSDEKVRHGHESQPDILTPYGCDAAVRDGRSEALEDRKRLGATIRL